MSDNSTNPSRRTLLGLASGAGFVAVAGCIDALSGEDTDAEFDVAIQDTNSPIEDGNVLEVIVEIENVGSDATRGTVTLDVAGLEPTTDVSLEPGEVTDVTLDARINTDDEGGVFEATVESATDSDAQEIIVQRPADLSVEVVSFTEEVVDGETVEAELSLANTGEVPATETVSMEVDELIRSADIEEVTIESGEAETVLLEWETDGETSAESVKIHFGDDEIRQPVSILEPAHPVITVEDANVPIRQGEQLEVTAQIRNEGEARISDSVTLTVDRTELDSEDVLIMGGSDRRVTLTGIVDAPVGEQEIQLELGDVVETGQFTVNFPVTVVESSVVETPEAGGELIEATLQNTTDEEMTVDVEGVIDVAEQSVQFQLPTAITDPAILTYGVPEGTHENQRTVTVPPNTETDVTLKIPVDPWPFDTSYLPDSDISVDYEYSVSVTTSDGESTALEPREQVIVSAVEVEQVALTDTLAAEVTNISDEAVSIDVVGVLEDADGDIDDNIMRRQSVSLEPGESKQIQFEGIGAQLDIPGLPFIEVDGMREDTGLNTGLIEDVEELS